MMERMPRTEREPERSFAEHEGAAVLKVAEGAFDAIDREIEMVTDFDLERIVSGSPLAREETESVQQAAEEELREIELEARKLQAETKRGICARIGKALKKNPLVSATLVAAALHAPLTPAGREIIDQIWDISGMSDSVLRIQSAEEMQETSRRVEERQRRINPVAVRDYKQDVRERMARGERVSLSELYFEMERLNGVDPEKVERSKKKAEQLSEIYTKEFGDDIDEQELRSFVHEMYGSNDNYRAGQASVSEYFETGKRNCVSVAKGQLIVLEGVIHRLPAEMQSRYTLGLTKEKQHEIATVTISDDDGRGFVTYSLEGGVERLKNTHEEAGTKFVPLELLKQGISSEKPIVLQAQPGEVAKSPDLIFTSDQPVDDGIVVEGKLRGSDDEMERAERLGIEPEHLATQDAPEEKPMEIEILDEEPQGPEDIKRISLNQNRLDAQSIVNPRPDAVTALVERAGKEHAEVWLPDLSQWTAESLERLVDSDISNLRFHQSDRELGIDRNVIEFLKKRIERTAPPVRIKRLTIGLPRKGTPEGNLPHVPAEQGAIIAGGFAGLEYLEIHTNNVGLGPREAAVFSDADIKTINFGHLYFEKDVAEILGKGRPTFLFTPDSYIESVIRNPDILGYENIKPDFNKFREFYKEQLRQGDGLNLKSVFAGFKKLILKTAPQRTEIITEIDEILESVEQRSDGSMDAGFISSIPPRE